MFPVQLNMNNIRDIKREEFTELFEGLATNSTLEELHLCNTGIGDLVAQVRPALVIWWVLKAPRSDVNVSFASGASN